MEPGSSSKSFSSHSCLAGTRIERKGFEPHACFFFYSSRQCFQAQQSLRFPSAFSFFLSTLQRESTTILFHTHLSFEVSSCWVRRQSVMTRGSRVIWCSSVCFVWSEEFLVMNFTHHILHYGWPMSFVKAWPVVFFFNKSRGEAKQAGNQSSCQDLTLWLAQYIGGDI